MNLHFEGIKRIKSFLKSHENRHSRGNVTQASAVTHRAIDFYFNKIVMPTETNLGVKIWYYFYPHPSFIYLHQRSFQFLDVNTLTLFVILVTWNPRYTFVVLCKIYIASKFFAKTIHGRPSYVRNWQVCNDVLGLSDSLSASQVTSTWDESGNIRYSFVFFL